MVDLNCNTGTVFVNFFCKFVQTWQIVVMVNTKLSSSVGTLRRIYTCVLYDDQTGAAFCTFFVETTIPGLYAAGDCTGGLLQVAKAVYEGAQAGINAGKYVRSLK